MAEYGIVACVFLPNAPQFGERTFSRQKASQSALYKTVRPLKCSAHGGRKVVHVPPCFQVPLRHMFSSAATAHLLHSF